MKAKIVKEAAPAVMKMNELKPGQVAKINDPDIGPHHMGKVILRTQHSLVDLDDPIIDFCLGAGWDVELLPAGTVIKITV
jgi:hypothetical protein